MAAARGVGGFHTAPVVDADPDPGAGPPWMVTAYTLQPVTPSSHHPGDLRPIGADGKTHLQHPYIVG